MEWNRVFLDPAKVMGALLPSRGSSAERTLPQGPGKWPWPTRLPVGGEGWFR